MRHLEALPLLNLAASLFYHDGTWQWDGEPYKPETGYQVGGLATLENPTSVEQVAEWLAKQSTEHAPHGYDLTQLGSWLDPETGTRYIDVTDHWVDPNMAMKIAEIFGEKAIWDWKYDRPLPTIVAG